MEGSGDGILSSFGLDVEVEEVKSKVCGEIVGILSILW
jgi:hypothetical protein